MNILSRSPEYKSKKHQRTVKSAWTTQNGMARLSNQNLREETVKNYQDLIGPDALFSPRKFLGTFRNLGYYGNLLRCGELRDNTSVVSCRSGFELFLTITATNTTEGATSDIDIEFFVFCNVRVQMLTIYSQLYKRNYCKVLERIQANHKNEK